MSFSENLRLLRKEKNLSLDDLLLETETCNDNQM